MLSYEYKLDGIPAPYAPIDEAIRIVSSFASGIGQLRLVGGH